MRRLFAVGGAAVAVSACTVGALAAAGAFARQAGSLPLNGQLSGNLQPTTCPTGAPSSIACYAHKGSGAVSGLGAVSITYVLFLDRANAACPKMRAVATASVQAKGTVSMFAESNGCAPDPPLSAGGYSLGFRVTGGTGAYAHATGSGTLVIAYAPSNDPTTITFTWRGTLDVSGLTFDLAPPEIAVHDKLVKARKRVKRVRVRYTATATDAVDGSVPVDCLPRSGSKFRVGRTKVRCTATDSSANSATATFTVTVKRKRRG